MYLKKVFLFSFIISMVSLTANAQRVSNNPLEGFIETEEDLVVVNIEEFVSIPDYEDGPARMMLMVDEPSTNRLFVNDMNGPIYSVQYNGDDVTLYVDIDDPKWDVNVQSSGRERGFQSFAFHPEFGERGKPGYGRFYTWSDVEDNQIEADFTPGGGNNSHHTVLHEWVAENAHAESYDGEAPRELMRFEQPFGNHNAGHLSFNTTAEHDDTDYGLLYIGSADGGSGGDPLNLSQDLESAFGKILRIDPLGSNSDNGNYGVPEDNPFVRNSNNTISEIYAYGMRNPQRFGWDPANGNLFMADIGQNIVEKVSLVPPGGNLGWNDWEGSFRFLSRAEVILDAPRSDPEVIYPVVEYSREDPLMHSRAAVTGVHVFRSGRYPELQNRVLFGDMVSGELLHFDADNLPEGGVNGIRRVLLRDKSGEIKTFLELIQEKKTEQGKEPATRTDLRFGTGPDGQFFLLNKKDGTIRTLVSE